MKTSEIRTITGRLIADEDAKEALREFFKILEAREESDSGHEFSPTYISCCRILQREKLSEILTILKNWSIINDDDTHV